MKCRRQALSLCLGTAVVMDVTMLEAVRPEPHSRTDRRCAGQERARDSASPQTRRTPPHRQPTFSSRRSKTKPGSVISRRTVLRFRKILRLPALLRYGDRHIGRCICDRWPRLTRFGGQPLADAASTPNRKPSAPSADGQGQGTWRLSRRASVVN